MALNLDKIFSNLNLKVIMDKVAKSKSNQTATESNKNVNDQALSDALKNIDNKYDTSVNTDISLPEKAETQRLEYMPPTDEQIAEYAKNSLAEYYAKSLDAIESDNTSGVKALNDYKKQIAQNVADKENQINEAYEQARKSIEADTLKRGLARSSIAASQVQAINEKKAQTIVDERNKALDAIAQIDYEISELDRKKTNALNQLDITYAAKLAMEIGNLQTQRDNKIAEVTKYNNELAKYDAEYEIARQKAEQDLKLGEYKLMKERTLTKAEVESAIADIIMKEKFETIMGFLESMPKSEAIKYAETNDTIKNNLDTYYYRKLLNALEARRS